MRWWQGKTVWGGNERRLRMCVWVMDELRMVKGLYKRDLRDYPYEVYKLAFDEGRLHELMLLTTLLQIRDTDLH